MLFGHLFIPVWTHKYFILWCFKKLIKCQIISKRIPFSLSCVYFPSLLQLPQPCWSCCRSACCSVLLSRVGSDFRDRHHSKDGSGSLFMLGWGTGSVKACSQYCCDSPGMRSWVLRSIRGWEWGRSSLPVKMDRKWNIIVLRNATRLRTSHTWHFSSPIWLRSEKNVIT